MHGYQCEVCDEVGANCMGDACIASFHARMRKIAAQDLELRQAGSPEMGKGIFARRFIHRGTIVCEYAGRLYPLDAQILPADGSYFFHHSGCAMIDSLVYGNISRFANHHCSKSNLDVVDTMYGQRKVLVYQTNRDVHKDEELFVNYGTVYWTVEKPCLCSASEDPHLAGLNGSVNKLPVKERVVMIPDEKKKAKSSPKSKSKLLTRPAGVSKL